MRARFPGGGALLGLAAVLAAGGAPAQESLDALRERLDLRLAQQLAAPLPAQDPALPPSAPAAPASEDEHRLAAAELDQALVAAGTDPFAALLAPAGGLRNRSVMARSASRGGSWPDLETAGTPERPEWLVDQIATRVQALSLAPRPVPPAPPSRGRQQLAWATLWGPVAQGAVTPGVRGEVADAVAWAGPAVRDGVATYRQGAGRTLLRITLAQRQAEDLYAWARRFGLALELRLRRPAAAAEEMVIEARTAIPVAVLNPDGLQAATVTAFAVGGDACSGGQWLELALETAAQPPVWAVFAFSRPELAQGVTVRRVRAVQAPAEQRPYLEAQRSEIEVRWPGDWLPPVNVTARRFDFRDDRYETLPDGRALLLSSEVAGSAWGTQVWTASPGTVVSGPGPRQLLSGGGSPACAPP